MYEPERRIDVSWAKDESAPNIYPVKLTVFCDDRYGMTLFTSTDLPKPPAISNRTISVEEAATATP